ncbi:phytase [Prolixibacteraceae bacterium JC049]|nr:phytase [Prolixibacteraceae bacterium JC049]
MRDLSNKRFLLAIIGLMFFICCKRASEGSAEAAKMIKNTVVADVETVPMSNCGVNDDAADDPAIWINSKQPEESKIIGTNKKGGLAVYNLKGDELFYYPDGMMNNVDIRYGFPMNSDTIDLVACSNRTEHSISFYSINGQGALKVIPCTMRSKMKEEVYGFCLAVDLKTNSFYAILNSKAGEVEQWLLVAGEKGNIEAELVRSLKINSKTEGVLAHDTSGQLFIGEEEGGIWLTEINHRSVAEPTLLKESVPGKNKMIRADIEGLTFYKNYLIASSQGNYSYAVFQLMSPHKYITSFRIVDGVFDGVEETDGIDATSANLGKDFPNGIFVVQDGFNFDNKKQKRQNFKLVNWDRIQKLIDQQ